MNKFTSISTENYVPLSHKEEYLHNKYDLIISFIENQFDEEFSTVLAFPKINNRDVDWFSKFKTSFKRVNEFSKIEQDKILNDYWQRINKIKELINSLNSSKSEEKKRWADLLEDVFNSNNNIIFSDGENIVLLWGWKFNTSKENYIPKPKKTVSPVINKPQIIDIPPTPKEPEIIEGPQTIEDPTDVVDDKPWYLLFWEWIKNFIQKFWWIVLLLLLFWILTNLESCSCNSPEKTIKEDYTNINNEDSVTYDYNPENQTNNWNPNQNNTGVPDEEFQQIIEENLPQDLYENLLTDEDGNPYKDFLPNKERVHIPINMDNLQQNENQQMISPDRINIYLKNPNDRIEDFAIKFKEEYPGNDYQIIYRDDNLRRLQIKIPEQERIDLKNKIKDNINTDVLIWDETIFQGSNYNDPYLKDRRKNYYFNNINATEAWKTTTGNKDIVIAVIDDGFDLNHPELNDNIIKPYNVLRKNDNVYASKKLNHGTHVSGLAISKKNNSKGACGIAPDCSFMPIQIGSETNPGMFTMNSIIDGVLYAVNNGADVINLSIQSIYPDEAKLITDQQLNEMIKYMSRDDELFWNELFKISNDSNISIVFAAGNYDVLIGLDAMKRYDNIITVSAVDQKNKRADFSNYGKRSTISAPGVDIWSCEPGGDFVMMDGTSMSAPIISGVVGLIKSVNPDLNNSQIKSILQSTGIEIDSKIGPLVQVDKVIEEAISLKVLNKNKKKKEEILKDNSNDDTLNKYIDNNQEIKELVKEKEDDFTEDFYFILLIIIGILFLMLISKKIFK